MIALSDIIILTVASVLLAVAVSRAYSPADAGKVPVVVSQARQQPSQVQNSNNTQTAGSVTMPLPAPQTSSPAANNGTQITAQQPAAAVTPAPAPAPAPEIVYESYTVRSGDSLSVIASRTGTSVQQLQDINQLSGTVIRIGQVLRYPRP